MTKILSSLVIFFFILTGVVLIISLVFQGIIFNSLQTSLLLSISLLSFSLYAQSKEQQATPKKILANS